MYKSSWKLSLHNAFLALIGFNHFYMCCFVMVLWGYCRFEIFCRFQHDSFLLFTLETDFWHLLVQIVFPQFCIYKKLKVCTKVNFDQKKTSTCFGHKKIGKNKKWQFWRNGKKQQNGQKQLAKTKNGNFEKMAKNKKMAILGNFFWFVDLQTLFDRFFRYDFP